MECGVTATITSATLYYRNCAALTGFVGASVLVRSLEHETEVVVATTWDSIESIRSFAREDYERAVVEPVVRDLMDHFEARVAHFNIAHKYSVPSSN